MEAKRDEGEGRILLDDNTGGGAVFSAADQDSSGRSWDLTGLPCINVCS